MSFLYAPARARRKALAALLLPAALLGSLLIASPAAAATNSLTITPIEWNVVGLDSNNVAVGPNQYSVGARVCNITGVAVTDISVAWGWTTTNAYISIDGSDSKTIASLAANTCQRLWWTVEVVRDAAALAGPTRPAAKRGFQITASAATVNSVSTPANREIYVESLVSQNRNSTDSLTGPTAVTVGSTVTYVLTGKTATNGYEQLSAGPTLDGSIFEIQSVAATYNVPTGATNTGFYADACGWNPGVGTTNYRSCVGPDGFTGGKAGGLPITVTVTAYVKATGSGKITGNIYDFSGSSYHYNSDIQVVNVVSTAPQPPIAVDDSASTTSGVGVLINVPFNDTDVDNDINLASVVVTAPASNGTTSVNAVTGRITYTPGALFVGTDTFTYRICDSQPVCDTALVTVTVSAPPSPPVAIDDSASTFSGVGVVITVPQNDTDVDGDLNAASVSITSLPSNGSVSVNPVTGAVTYTPGSAFVGTVTFDYQICDSRPVCDTARVTVTVTAPPSPPVANDDSALAASNVGVLINVPLNDSDADGDLNLTSVLVTVGAANGATSVNPLTGRITYTSNPGFVGIDTFTYRICDGQPVCDTALVTVTVSASAPLPSPPVAADDSAVALSGVGVLINVPLNDRDPDGDLDATSVFVTVAPTNGATSVNPVSGRVTYTPNLGFVGNDTFTYRICDSQPVCDTALVTITVSAPPSPPVANDDSASTLSGVGVVITVPQNDTDVDRDLNVASVSITSRPSNGSVSVNPVTGAVTYTPGSAFVGTVTFDYQICDSRPVCDTAVVTVTVTASAPPAPPVAQNNAVSTKPSTPVTIDVLANDTDPNNDIDPALLRIVSPPSHGRAVIDPVTFALVYTPEPGFTGLDTLSYEICDEQSMCTTAVVTVSVTALAALAATGVEPASPSLAAFVALLLGALAMVAGARRRRSRLA